MENIAAQITLTCLNLGISMGIVQTTLIVLVDHL